LPFANQEVNTIRDLIDDQSWINNAATKTQLLQSVRDYQILHFALHAFRDSITPLDNTLVMAAGDSSAKKYALLSAKEILAQKKVGPAKKMATQLFLGRAVG